MTVSIPVAAAAILGLIILLIRNAILNRRIERHKFAEDMYETFYNMKHNETIKLKNKMKELERQLKFVKKMNNELK